MLSGTRRDEARLALDELRRLVHGLRLSTHTAQRELGLTGAQLFVLRELSEEPGASIRRLSERTLTDPSSVSVVVSRLVEQGLVARRQSKDDARQSVLSVTRRGRTLLDRAPVPFQVRLVAALEQLPLPSLRKFRQALAQLSTALDAADASAPLFFETPLPEARTARAGIRRTQSSTESSSNRNRREANRRT